MQVAQITDPVAAANFMFGGKATFTLRSLKTGSHISYRVQRKKDGDIYFVKARRNADGEGGFNYLGYIKPTPHGAQVRTSAKSKPMGNALPALEWTLAALCRQHMPKTLEVWHEGRCARCNRPLTDPKSVALGIGPECRKKG